MAGRILIIDDDAAVARCLARVLRPQEVTIAPTGAAAMEHARQGSFDLIICDLSLPDIHGVDLFEELRKVRPDLAEKLVFVTGGGLSPGGQPMRIPRGIEVLTKPVPLDTVRGLLARGVIKRAA